MALEQAVSLGERFLQQHCCEPGLFIANADLVEAYARSGAPVAAQDVAAQLEWAAQTTERMGGLAVAARCQGLVANDARFEEHFECALALHGNVTLPFDEARTLLCYGERLRRAKRTGESREMLRRALGTFEALGAAPWARRARTELTASGIRTKPRGIAPPVELTPQELQVVQRVAGGATNQEAAADLFLSPKTIEFHLRQVFRKLDVRSRTQLAVVAMTQGLVGEGPPTDSSET
jgi:DNA-binding CsgD family transcriptional regulator